MKTLTGEKPSLREALEHFGVMGMHWGSRKGASRGTGKPMPTRKQRRQMDKTARARQKGAAKAADKQNDAEIQAARARVAESYAHIRAAKKKYKTNKKQLGKVTAREIMDKTTQKDYNTLAKADERTHKERVAFVIGAVASVAVSSALRNL